MADPEHLSETREHSLEHAAEAAAEQSEKLRAKHEKSGEAYDDSETRTSKERANVESLFSKEQSAGERKQAGEPSAPKKSTKSHTKTQKKLAYKETMKHVQAEMSPASRTFSKIIHSPAVETTSDVVGKTIARPNAILAGGFTAFVVTLGLYWLAQYMGFPLSGFEMIGAFIVGWVAGVLFDFLRVMVTGKTN